MKITKTYNIQIWVGLKEQYSDIINTIDDVRGVCDEYVNNIGDCVTITPTEYRYVNGSENGVVIGLINYPIFCKSKREIKKRAFILAEKLMISLNQYRVTVTTPKKSYMLENNFKK
jgi:hypothetical protein